jgi:hypothetical protein
MVLPSNFWNKVAQHRMFKSLMLIRSFTRKKIIIFAFQQSTLIQWKCDIAIMVTSLICTFLNYQQAEIAYYLCFMLSISVQLANARLAQTIETG